jgi:hypothetical protein
METKGIGTFYKVLIGSSIAVVAALVIGYRYRAAKIAEKWVGITEKGDNAAFSNDVFEAMMKSVGWRSGEAWCMYLAKAIHIETFPKDKDKINKLLTGSTQLSWKNVTKDTSGLYKIVTSGQPQRGDIAIFQRVTDTSKGHAAIVIERGGNSFKTIEGNTNNGGSSEGDKVLIQTRQLDYNKTQPNSSLKLLGFIRKRIPILGW